MIFNVNIDNRDFSTQPIKPFTFQPKKLTWSVYGGCDQAVLSAHVPFDRLMEFTSLLRCPVTVSDSYSLPVWWGYVDQVKIYFEKSHFEINLSDLYNRVQVKYAHPTPDGFPVDYYETEFKNNNYSRGEYGTRETVLLQRNIDDDFALALRDTFLELASLPRSVLSPNATYEDPRIELHCKGWFSTLDWMFYEQKEYFYAHNGPGPGAVQIGTTFIRHAAQRIKPGVNCAVSHIYFRIRRVGSPTANVYARIYTDSGGPSSSIGQSSPINPTTLDIHHYQWTRFSFTTPVNLTAGSFYWAVFYTTSVSDDERFAIKLNEQPYNLPEHSILKVYDGSIWKDHANITIPGLSSTLFFRVVCLEETGSQLASITTAGNQFFTNIRSLSTGINTCPYRFNGASCLDEVITLMKLGTSNQRLILADVNHQRRLTFYEQPPADQPTVFMDRFGRFFTQQQTLLPPYRPPIGQYAILSGVDRIAPPFDNKRTPAYFVDHAEYIPLPNRSDQNPS